MISSPPDAESIINAIRRAMSDEYRAVCQKVAIPYRAGQETKQIAKKTIESVKSGRIDLKKHSMIFQK